MRIFGWEVIWWRRKRHSTQFLGELVKVDLSPGDVCVLMTHKAVSRDAAERIRESWRVAVGDDVTLLVLDDGLRLGVLSPPHAAAVHDRLSDGRTVEAAVVR